MRLKLDENLGRRVAEILRGAGHDVATVPEQGLCSATDTTLIEACRQEGRSLVTLDLDFANPLRFKSSEYPGIAVLRLPPRTGMQDLTDALLTLVAALRRSLSRESSGLFSEAASASTSPRSDFPHPDP